MGSHYVVSPDGNYTMSRTSPLQKDGPSIYFLWRGPLARLGVAVGDPGPLYELWREQAA